MNTKLKTLTFINYSIISCQTIPLKKIPEACRPVAISDSISNEHLIKKMSRDYIYYEIK